MAKIASVASREVLDSRGWPTVEAEVALSDGSLGRAAVPSGATTGSHEAVELRDGDKGRYSGKGVLKAVGNVNGELAKAVKGLDASEASELDLKMRELDATENKGRLGANAILAISMAAARAEASSRKKPLYVWLREAYAIDDADWLLPAPMLNVVNGGKHADSGLDVQEFMIVPFGAETFAEAIRVGAETYHALKKLLAAKKLSTAVGDEGGFAPHITKHEDVLKVLLEAVGQAGHDGKVFLALDSAASEFYGDGAYKFEGKPRSADEMVGIYAAWAGRYPIRSFEDPLSEDDWDGWAKATAKLGGKARVIGDDLFVTNPVRLGRGIREKSANAILIKLNQIGTLTETVETVRKAQKSGFAAVISHRSGETEDAFISDLAVALNAGAIKTGAPCRSERNAKYNQLLRIEAELGPKASYAGDRMFRLP